jgi:hypothetical protein
VRVKDGDAVSYSGSQRTFNTLVSYVERIPGPLGAPLTFYTFWMTNLTMIDWQLRALVLIESYLFFGALAVVLDTDRVKKKPSRLRSNRKE